MHGECAIVGGGQVFIEAKDDFYRQFLRGWFTVDSVVVEKNRFTVRDNKTGGKYKMFRNRQGICCVVEHEFNRYGESTWDSEKQQHRYIFVPIEMYVAISSK